MWEFAGRWVVVMTVVALALGRTKEGAPEGTGAGGWLWMPWTAWAGWAAGLWVGFWNALLRPLVLRSGLEGPRVIGLMGVVIFGVNAALFYDIDTWVPWLGTLDWRSRAVVGTASALVSWAVSSVFHSHDRRWHWITYHGAVQRARAQRDQKTSHPDENKQ